ncbi:hypothetical protein OAO18_02615 [Francisellaceae bacterium]|nr:hypothetical protein [Francisellaceae bacterium]
MTVYFQKVIIFFSLIFISTLFAADIYTVPDKDLPFKEYQYDVTINVEINVYGNTLETEEIEETMTERVHPYTIHNMKDKTVRTRIIENDFVSVHVLQTSPSEIGTFTEDLFTGDASEALDSSLSSLQSSDSN